MLHLRGTVRTACCDCNHVARHLAPAPTRRDTLLAARLMMSRLSAEATEAGLRATLGALRCAVLSCAAVGFAAGVQNA